jgi:hypothetical protein
MHGPINVKSPNNSSKLQMGFNSAFKGLNNRKLLSGILPTSVSESPVELILSTFKSVAEENK